MANDDTELNSKFDFSLTTDGLSPVNSRCTIDGGGYCKLGNLVVFQVKYTAKTSLATSNYWTMISGFPPPVVNAACSDFIAAERHANFVGEINSGGYLVIHNASAFSDGDEHYATGCYISAN